MLWIIAILLFILVLSTELGRGLLSIIFFIAVALGIGALGLAMIAGLIAFLAP